MSCLPFFDLGEPLLDILEFYHSLGTFLLKMCQNKFVYIYLHNALTGVQVLVTLTPGHAHCLAHFSWSLLIVTTEKGKAIEISYLDARSLVTFSGV
jgi:hypothetical protein